MPLFNPAGGGGGIWTKVGSSEVVGAPVASFGFSGLLGNLNEEFRLIYSVLHSAPGTVRDWGIKLNGLFTNMSSSFTTSGTRGFRANKIRLAQGLRERIDGKAYIYTTPTPEGSAVARARYVVGMSAVFDVPADANIFDQESVGTWSDTVTEVTDIDFVCTTDSGAGAAAEAANIGIGSVITLWKRNVG